VGVGTGGTTITGTHSGPLIIGPGVTSLDGATVTGAVKIAAGAIVSIQGSRPERPLTADGTASLALCRSTVSGPLTVKNATGLVPVGGTAGSPSQADTIGGPVTLTANTGGVEMSNAVIGGPANVKDNTGGTLPAGNTISGPLSCSGNNPPPADDGAPLTPSRAQPPASAPR
jgi:hypothetical protein